MKRTTTRLREPQGTIPTNSYGCIAGRRCRCPRAFRRCSLYTRYPEYDEDPVLVEQS